MAEQTHNTQGTQNLDVATQPLPSKRSLFKRNARAWMALMLMISDVVCLLIAFLLAVNIRIGGNYGNQNFFVDFFWLPIPLMILIFTNYNLYPGIGLSSVEEVRRLSIASTLLFLLLVALTFLLKTSAVYSRIVFLVSWGLTLFMLPIGRNIIRQICVRLKVWGEPVGIIGYPDRRVAEVADFFVKYPQKGIAPKAIFIDNPELVGCSDCYEIYKSDDVYTLAKYLRISTVLLVVSNWNWVGENLDTLRYSFERVILVRPQRDTFSLTDSVALDFNGVTGFQVMHNLLNPWSMAVKRVIDITVSSLALLFLFPFLAFICLLIRIGSPGPIFYRQSRLGRGGKSFKFIKFRTMYINGDEIFQRKIKEDKEFRDEWRKFQKVKNDPRITKIGSFLRKYSIDELPQLINILKGDMSLVGPRPIMDNQRDMYGPSFHDYSQVRPGVTGLWQISGRNLTTFARRVEFDMEYIQRWSIWLDIYIIFRTFKEVVAKDGAY